MNRRFVFVLAVLIVLALPASLLAKGRTIMIRILTGDHTQPIEVKDPALGQFHVWDGPGTFVNNVPQMKGFIIEWSKGVVEQHRKALRRYQISFYTGCVAGDYQCDEKDKPRLSYVVLYEYDAPAKTGYVYLPGKADEWYSVNTRSILRGLEGNWFIATSAWREFVAPVLAETRLDNRQR